MRNVFFTVGHATRPIGAFLDLLRQVEILMMADVRSVPRSKTNPQFNRELLVGSLSAIGIEYQHIPELGGLRSKQKDRIISDYLIAAGNTVFHILGPDDIEQARITEGAKPGPDDVLIYPADL